MIDLKKKYTFRGDKVLGVHHYPEVDDEYNYLVVCKPKEYGVLPTWIKEGSENLVEVKPEPVKVTKWFNVYEDGVRFMLNGNYGYSSEKTALNSVQKKGIKGLKYIKTISIEVEVPVEDE